MMPAKESRESEASVFILGVMSTLLLHTMIVPDRWVLVWDVSNLRVSANTEILVLCVLPATVLLDLNILIVQGTLQAVLLCCIMSAEIRGCVRLFLQISTYHLLRHLIVQQ